MIKRYQMINAKHCIVRCYDQMAFLTGRHIELMFVVDEDVYGPFEECSATALDKKKTHFHHSASHN